MIPVFLWQWLLQKTPIINGLDWRCVLTSGRVVVAPLLPELFYMLVQRVDYVTALAMFTTIHSAAFRIESLTDADMLRMREIMNIYRDNEFDFVDTAIMAVAERLNIAEIYTFDRRDFSVFRPHHRDYLRLLP